MSELVFGFPVCEQGCCLAVTDPEFVPHDAWLFQRPMFEVLVGGSGMRAPMRVQVEDYKPDGIFL